jgi:predicted nuclease of predicted toxin-antitoxin system
MRFKLDENLGTRTQRIFKAAEHDVVTVRDESLEGATDQHLYRVCCEEGRCLVTLDLDFADVIRFPPQQAGGIVVIRVPRNPTLVLLERMVRRFLESLDRMSVEKRLWIVEVDRIRIHQTGESST